MTDVVGRAKVIVTGEVDSTSVSTVGSKIGGLLSSALKTGAIGAAAGIGAAVGATIFKGFERLSAIDDAKAKLKGLGNSAKTVTTIMNNALASVKGTAFGLGDAASVAASAVASGVKPGQELERTLRLVADAATIGGTSLDEMGAIFNKVSATGKAQGEVLNQLGERGIPIIQLLSKSLGVSSAEVVDLASQGKISFAEFQTAIEAGMGGAALEAGDTFRGSLANVGAAIGRVGAALLGKSFKSAPDLFKAITKKLDELEPIARKVGDRIGDISGAIKTFVNSKHWKLIQSSMEDWGKDLITVGKALASIVKSMNSLTPKGSGGGLLDFLVKLEEHTTPLKVLADLIERIQAAAKKADVGIGDVLFGAFGITPHAAGGPASGWSLVGEQGPELVNLPNGSYVHNANETKEMLAPPSGGNTQNYYITGPVSLAELRQRAAWYDTYGTRFG